MDKEILCSLRSMQDQATTISIANKRGYDDAHPQKSDVSAPTISRSTNVAPVRPPHISEAVDKLQNGINSPVTLSATKGFQRQKQPQQIQGELERRPKRKTDRCSQSLTGTCSLPFQSDPFWILLTSCCCGGATATGPELFLLVKSQISPWGLCPPSTG